MPGNHCSKCITARIKCTHDRLKEGEMSSSALLESVKTAQEHVASILSTTTVYVPSDDPNVTYGILVKVAQYARSLEQKLVAVQPKTLVPIPNPGSSPEDSPSPHSEHISTDAEDDLDINDYLRALSVQGTSRYYGRSSSVQFIQDAIRHVHGKTSHVVGVQRPEFWNVQPWEKNYIELPRLVFPEDDLLKALVKTYFEQINPITGILHFPSFHQSLSDGLHFRDPQFGGVVLMVCALASRYSDDPRIFVEGATEHSCGWKWFRQVRLLRAIYTSEPSLYQLQLICLTIPYTSGTSMPEECWILTGLGIRIAQSAGAHHRGGYSKMDPLTAELYRRVFWVLVIAETVISTVTGRPSIVNPSDLDLDLPTVCDDEFLGSPNAVQPEGKPATSAFLPTYLQLMLIFARIQQAVSPFNGEMRLHEQVAELDRTLNEWVNRIPDHLRWDPHQENQIFLDQSAILYATYYYGSSIMFPSAFVNPQSSTNSHTPPVHPGPRERASSKPDTISFVQYLRKRRAVVWIRLGRANAAWSWTFVHSDSDALFDAAVVLLVNVWAVVGGGKPQTPEDFAHATADVQNCVRVLRLYERRWRGAGRNCDIIAAMLNIGRYTSQSHSLKRMREEEEVMPAPLETPEDLPKRSNPQHYQKMQQRMQALERSIQDTDHLFSLPLHTQELGRLPVYQSFDYQPAFQSTEPLHYMPRSHFDSRPDPMNSTYGFDPLLDSASFSHQDGTAGGENIQLRPNSFDIPPYHSWQAWSTYLASVDSLNQENH
ncbi:Fungal-trans domain-containing protein [Mycena venus]|uniref:Fungal-trans domain-containing protein n=1 Tax=Mycena venus TaxID=2733690 RepID=A0A8H7CR28_9AGAR|nr:Fungal-trans domain-containing protein [Mycena venus]